MTGDPDPSSAPGLISTGVPGLDDVLHGGLSPNHLYLLEGDPGAGKTTAALQFLLAGSARGEACMFVTLSETASELRASAASHGWSLDGIHVLEVTTSEEKLATDARYTMFHPSEVELADTVRYVLAEAARIKPARLVFDSLSELRLLAENPLRYRRQILALKHHFSSAQCTVVLVDDRTGSTRDMHLHSLAHGAISLERETAEYGTMRRKLEVRKMRGRAFREGFHDFTILRGGLCVFPRLVAAEHGFDHVRDTLGSGLRALDDLLAGGLARGTSTLIMGPAGSGKSSLATQFVRAAADRGEKSATFLFDESIASFHERSQGLGFRLHEMLESHLQLRAVDPAELSPGQFVAAVRHAVEVDDVRMLVIDSLSGYVNAMPSERFLLLHLHELLTYLNHRGVTTILVLTQHGVLGTDSHAPFDASYLADTVLLLRYYEALGEVRQALSVIKKRTGPHERTIRELRFANGIIVGPPILGFEGVLTGAPRLIAAFADTKREP
jgi:circadian clock protein KaiC